jgi:N-acetylglucosamine kinase-like BadF-type ATPase
MSNFWEVAMAYILAVDGGGSKTYAVLLDESGNLLGSGLSGCGNYQVLGIEVVSTNIRKACEAALVQANLLAADVDFVQYGLAGADRPKDIQILNRMLEKLPFPNWGLVCDTFEGLRLGSDDFTGVVLVCGSGTNAAGRDKEGHAVQIGGFGYLYGDRAGGSEMAKETFSLAVRSWEGREIPSRLTEFVPKFLGYETLEQLFNDYLDHDKTSVPRDLTLVLHRAADDGDELAIQYLRRVGEELAIAAYAVVSKLHMEARTIPVILVGSVLQSGRSPYLLDQIEKYLTEKGNTVDLRLPTEHPVYGSALLAFDKLGIPVTSDLRNRLRSYGMVTKV